MNGREVDLRKVFKNLPAFDGVVGVPLLAFEALLHEREGRHRSAHCVDISHERSETLLVLPAVGYACLLVAREYRDEPAGIARSDEDCEPSLLSLHVTSVKFL
jgi:hypothetical protein